MRLFRLFGIAALAAGVLGSAPAFSGVVVLDFAGLNGDAGEHPLEYYNGGTGSLGSGPGTNYGVSFGADAIACSGQPGGACNSSAIPGGPGANLLTFLTGPGDILNVAAGFTSGLSFFYSAIAEPGSVSVYSGLDGTGTVLAMLDLAVTPSTPGSGGCDPKGTFCPYVPVGVTFAGTAMSVIFTGNTAEIAFADITLGSASAGGGGGTSVPEPATVALLGLGALGGAGIRRRARH